MDTPKASEFYLNKWDLKETQGKRGICIYESFIWTSEI